MTIKKTEFYFNDRSAGIFADHLYDRDGLPVRDTFADQLRVKLMGVETINWTKDQLREFISKMSSRDMMFAMSDDRVCSLMESVKNIRHGRVTHFERVEMDRFAEKCIKTYLIDHGGEEEDAFIEMHSAINPFKKLGELAGIPYNVEDIEISALEIGSEYDDNPALAKALSEAIDGFEYPDWAHRTIGDALYHVSRMSAGDDKEAAIRASVNMTTQSPKAVIRP